MSTVGADVWNKCNHKTSSFWDFLDRRKLDGADSTNTNRQDGRLDMTATVVPAIAMSAYLYSPTLKMADLCGTIIGLEAREGECTSSIISTVEVRG